MCPVIVTPLHLHFIIHLFPAKAPKLLRHLWRLVIVLRVITYLPWAPMDTYGWRSARLHTDSDLCEFVTESLPPQGWSFSFFALLHHCNGAVELW